MNWRLLSERKGLTGLPILEQDMFNGVIIIRDLEGNTQSTDRVTIMASFVASSYAKVPDGSTKGFPSWSEESITGTYYASFVVSKILRLQVTSYPDLIGKDVQIVTYPVNWSGSEHSKIFSTPHAAGFDSAKG